MKKLSTPILSISLVYGRYIPIVALLFLLNGKVFGQAHPDEPFGGGLYASSINTSLDNITKLKNDVIPKKKLRNNILGGKTQSTGTTVGQAITVSGGGIVLGMGIVYGVSTQGDGLLVSAEQKKIYEIITISGVGIIGVGILTLIISEKYENNHPTRFFSVIGTQDHVGFAYNF